MNSKIIKSVLLISLLFSYLVNPIIFNFYFFDNLPSKHKDMNLLHTSQPSVDLSILPEIDYDSLYHDWYHPKLEMLIITPDNQSFINAVTPLKEWKNKKGVRTIILSNFSLYEGRDKAEKIRKMIKSYYQTENIQWVLLAGDATEDLIPIRYVYNPDTIEHSGSEYNGYDEYLKPTDFYYADLTGSWDEDGDGKWGESSRYNSHGVDEISWSPEVYVGRLPASTADELEIMINKTINYEKNPNVGDWMNRMLLAGGISSYSPAEDETRLTTYVIQNYIQSEMNYTHLTEHTSSYTPPDPKEVLTQNNFISHFNEGYSTVFFAGHADPFKLNRNPSNDVAYTNNDAKFSNNSNKTSLIYVFGCTTSPIDQNDNNIGEILIKRDNLGAVGYIGGLRLNWYFDHDTNLEKLNRGNAKLFWETFFEKKKFQQGRTLYDSKVSYMNSPYFDNPSVSMRLEYERKNVLTYCLLGDPELDVYTSIPERIKNPFLDGIHEGQNISITIKNVEDEIVPYARLSIVSTDGLYRAFLADDKGHVNFIIPAIGSKTYNITITGHNIRPSYFNFPTLLDTIEPEIKNLQFQLGKLNQSITAHFNAEVFDSGSGIEKVFLLLSNDDFGTFWIYPMEEVKNNTYELQIDGLIRGKYSYIALARDLASNTNILQHENFSFEVIKEQNEDAIKNILLFLLFLPIIALTGIFIFIIYKKYQMRIEKKREWELISIRIRKQEMMDKLRKKKRIK